ncbi:MAG: hypothetical protein A2452_11770 [Candidatus Firestonebacteria bacterium RIFOXYC2_FULL_39_67]|nr:MAG: hypothetical protein A2536_07540 [Candidatus Firestonebacteria bacterium RIFOXYD2_FULL_39_29]OGF51827.1 MAG: hypothetical protein A2497_01900 [Candidatus Firestonebacteria bacterium RifOxyC12_full_39_7]OGF53898.1 MAG: hypothetical protein A2452_11770 [Candidatus Firestonebacteria bacterium RIFOXYC2_FULL_39_67]
MGRGYKDLEVWKKAKDLAVKIYKQAGTGKIAKDYGLREQLQRSSVSIASNIAEGEGRESSKESIRFFYISMGSLAELETQLQIAFEIGLLEESVFKQIEKDCASVGKMTRGLINYRK